MQVENKTLVITDPCYIKRRWAEELTEVINKSTIYGDWGCFTYPGTKEDNKELIEAWDEAYHAYIKVLWDTKATLEEKDAAAKKMDAMKKDYVENHIIGQFCADSGEVGVYTIDNDKWESASCREYIESHKHMFTVIEGYTGNVEYVVEGDGMGREAHIVGDTFYTVQSTL